MDNLLEALKNGSAFNVNRERKDGRKRTPRAAGGQYFVADYVLFCLACVLSSYSVERVVSASSAALHNTWTTLHFQFILSC